MTEQEVIEKYNLIDVDHCIECHDEGMNMCTILLDDGSEAEVCCGVKVAYNDKKFSPTIKELSRNDTTRTSSID